MLKKSISVLLTVILILALCLPVQAAFPQTHEEAKSKRSLSANTGLENNWVDAPMTLYNESENTADVSARFDISGYNLLSSDTELTLSNRGKERDFYVWAAVDYFVRNGTGEYVLSSTGATLRNSGFVTRDVAESSVEDGAARKKLYAGESISFSASQLNDGYTGKTRGSDMLYRITVYLEYPDEGDFGMYWYSTYYYRVDEAEVARRQDEEGKAQEEGVKGQGNISFTDVPEDAYYHNAVMWALINGVTTGTSATTFGPNDPCTRGQVVTFLWRAKGCPEPKSSANPFTDVKESDYYYKPVLWALENSITTGTTATSFEPETACTSGQVITFLWRAEGEPKARGTSTLAKIYPDQYYTKALAWAELGGLLEGTGREFLPAAESPRADIVTYLYRNLTK